MNTTGIGKAAEQIVAKCLELEGYEIIELNWRRPSCEIDIIAQKGRIAYFIEVKFRASDSQGSGLDYITPKKLKQIKYAAELWMSESNWSGDGRICAASVSFDGKSYFVENLVEVS